MCVEDNFKLPPTLFTSKTLVVLNLVSGIVLKVPASVWLPSLKVLDLDSIEREKEDTFESLFRGCPALEELYIERWTLDTNWVLNISIPTFKRLILICPEDHFRGGSDGQGCKVVINTPKLEQLDLLDYVSDDSVLENSSSSLKAVVDIGHTHSITETNNYGSHIHKLFSGIKNVKFLDATLSFPTEDDTPVLPTLHNLTHLTLTADHESGWNFLTDFLECSPRLEVLTLKGNGQLGSAKCWSPPQRVPNCLLLHLEEIKIKKFNGEENDFEAMEYLLKNAKFLKKMTIDCRQSNVNEEFCIWKKLIGIPRGSKTSLLNLIF
ncbi:F-box/FBD/LRR-repeat protein [Camellia lanceoleosa]|uniref:F-box/FBD/LRR-repeat protein n=1 Tax=Camellia lanceoleosa TaxID=1840588 RepID=A0ACC0H420_9ERIC|nr:F-box/FBD/LRR-repeat protein [Camellia lanceoleosa]